MIWPFNKLKNAVRMQLRADLIRSLVKNNMDRYTMTLGKQSIDKLPIMNLMQLPEATIFTITEEYCALRANRATSDEAFRIIEAKRSMAAEGYDEYPTDLVGYAHYRVGLEHGPMPYETVNRIIALIKQELQPTYRQFI